MDLMTNTNFKRKLPVPQEIKKEMPLTKEAEEIKAKRMKKSLRFSRAKVTSFCLLSVRVRLTGTMRFLTIFTALQWFKPTLRTRF